MIDESHAQNGGAGQPGPELNPEAVAPTGDASPVQASSGPVPPADDVAAIGRLNEAYRRLTAEIGKVIVGQQNVVEELLIAMFSGSHCLLVGVPGLAKTLMIRTLADAVSLQFNRIQFTPDLMPADIIGTEVIQEDRQTGTRGLRFIQGPIFANVILADEINRTPPKTQAALLEAMMERQVTSGGQQRELPRPFFVLATQNPIEQEGTYPLPEAELDRFMFNVLVDYPTEEDERQIVRQTTTGISIPVSPVLSAEELLELQGVVGRVPIAEPVLDYAVRLARMSRPKDPGVPAFVKEFVIFGAGPRCGQNLVLASKARAALQGRPCVSTEDIRSVALPVMRHRILTNFNARAEGITTDDLIRRLLEAVPVDRTQQTNRSGLPDVFRPADAR